MSRLTKNQLAVLSKFIDRLHENNLHPVRAEDIIWNILEPLLKDSGYEVVRLDRDRDIDFVAQRIEYNSSIKDIIGIEYKHYSQSFSLHQLKNIIGRIDSSNYSRIMIVTNSSFTKKVRDYADRLVPVEVELIDIDALKSWLRRVEVESELNMSEIEVIRLRATKAFINAIAKNKDSLMDLEWREVEFLIAEAFSGLGFYVELTPGSKDGGKDIILECWIKSKKHTYYVEIKHWRSRQKVGKSTVSSFIKVVINEKVTGGLLLSPFGVCSSAIEGLTEIERKNIRFGDDSKISNICKNYVKATSGIWLPEPNLPDVVYSDTY